MAQSSSSISVQSWLSPAIMAKMENTINILILLNAIAFGLLTDSDISSVHTYLELFCDVSLWIFVAELIVRIAYYRGAFFTGDGRGWNIFDTIIVVLSFLASIPAFASIRIFRLFRIFRQLNILRVIPSAVELRLIIEALGSAISGIMWTAGLFFIIIYTYGLIGCEFFGAEFPAWFGNAWRSIYTLFQVMTLESWSMGIARPVMDVYPAAWIYFVSYVILSSFVILNIVVAIVVNSLQSVTEMRRQKDQETDKPVDDMELLAKHLDEIEQRISEIRATMRKNK